MTKDRLPELYSINGTTSNDKDEIINNPFAKFSKYIGDIYNTLDILEVNIKQIRDLHTKLLASPFSKEYRVEWLREEIKEKIVVIRGKLQDIHEDIYFSENSSQTKTRILKVQRMNILKKFGIVLLKYNWEQIVFQQLCKELICDLEEMDGFMEEAYNREIDKSEGIIDQMVFLLTDLDIAQDTGVKDTVEYHVESANHYNVVATKKWFSGK